MVFGAWIKPPRKDGSQRSQADADRYGQNSSKNAQLRYVSSTLLPHLRSMGSKDEAGLFNSARPFLVTFGQTAFVVPHGLARLPVCWVSLCGPILNDVY